MTVKRQPYVLASWQSSVDPRERRGSARYPVVKGEARVGWQSGPEWHSIPAHLLDISHGGARVRVDRLPPPGQPIRLRLEGPPPSDWVEAEVVEVIRPWFRRPRLRLAFVEPCPYSLFASAAYGHGN